MAYVSSKTNPRYDRASTYTQEWKLLDFGRVLVVLERVDPIGPMPIPKGLDMILERPLVLEIRATRTIPQLPAVLLVGPPVTAHGKGFSAFAADKGLDAVLPFVVGLKGAEVFKGLGTWVVNVVAAAWGATVAREPEHGSWLRASKGFGAFTENWVGPIRIWAGLGIQYWPLLIGPTTAAATLTPDASSSSLPDSVKSAQAEVVGSPKFRLTPNKD
ncbi:glyceraldehyde-3-phosphate dehydrogenase A [Striga asiatica]|uniref:Glyceraldehyde-3-phosphate dehydrogenase A n=1 Tax=Striga asiatica TaxID=4170 RepID=A0A5A7Q758_STRAF|nr:glyceraldehyde-3-phosphate dehydrogenase A [Striga asiatica]